MYHPFIFTVHTVIFDLRAPCEAHRTLFSTQTSPWGSLITLLLSPGLINGTLTYQPICGSEGQRGGVQKEETTDVPQTRQGQRDGGRRTERLQRMETDESTPSSQGAAVVGWSIRTLPKLRDVSLSWRFKRSIAADYVAYIVCLYCACLSEGCWFPLPDWNYTFHRYDEKPTWITTQRPQYAA